VTKRDYLVKESNSLIEFIKNYHDNLLQKKFTQRVIQTHYGPLAGIDLGLAVDGTVTEGICISIKAFRSDRFEFGFQYNVRISTTPEFKGEAILTNRNWFFDMEGGETQEVRGAGIIGLHPQMMEGGKYSVEDGVVEEGVFR